MLDTLTIFLKYFSRILMLLMVMPVVNSVKGIVASKLGDDTAETEGRITLNPFVHLDPIGALAIILCGFGWSKPLPINPNRMRNYRKGVIIISLTGPLTHFVSAVLCQFIFRVLSCIPSFGNFALSSENRLNFAFCILMVLSILAQINICLGVISLLPLPPLDGFVILHFCTGNKFNRWYYSNMTIINQISPLILFALFFMPYLTGGLLDPLGWLIDLVGTGLGYLTAWVPAVFGK